MVKWETEIKSQIYFHTIREKLKFKVQRKDEQFVVDYIYNPGNIELLTLVRLDSFKVSLVTYNTINRHLGMCHRLIKPQNNR